MMRVFLIFFFFFCSCFLHVELTNKKTLVRLDHLTPHIMIKRNFQKKKNKNKIKKKLSLLPVL